MAVVPTVVPPELHQAGERDERLAVLVAAWPSLPDAIKAGILALVEATKSPS
jgi:hypothetical protein